MLDSRDWVQPRWPYERWVVNVSFAFASFGDSTDASISTGSEATGCLWTDDDSVVPGTEIAADKAIYIAGITMPSPVAQAALIRDTYARAGLDLSNPSHRPQYFEAHGTGKFDTSSCHP